MGAPRVSVVVTVHNEAPHIVDLLGSLIDQDHLHEVVLVDAMSTDGTVARVRDYVGRLPLQIIERACGRGEGRNIGAEAAEGDLLVFIDGDCWAEPGWLRAIVSAWEEDPQRVVAGRTVLTGREAFRSLDRVELEHQGQDMTWPSCNLAYPRSLFRSIQGFDPVFVTAEDIDLNYRAVEAGARIVHAPEAVVHARVRGSVPGFLKQAFWNGYGRKQLTRKHGPLWHTYKPTNMLRIQGNPFWASLRLGAGFCGYVRSKFWRKTP